MMTTVHTTRRDAIQREIAPALVECGGDFDVEAIADEVLVWHVEQDEQGHEIVTEGRVGYVLRADVDFWEVAGRHDRAAVLDAARTSYGEAKDARRRLVLEAVKGGMTKSRVSELSGVSRPTIDKWLAEA